MEIINLFDTKQKRNCFFVFSAFSVAIMVLIFIFSAQSGEESQATSDGFLAKVLAFIENTFKGSKIGVFLTNLFTAAVRRMAHCFIYAVLAFSVSGAVFCLRKPVTLFKKVITALAICFIYAITDEIHQLFVPLRSFELGDILVDFTGALVGTLFLTFVFYVFRAIRKRKNKISQ